MPGSFAKKQICKKYGEKLKFHNWEDSVSLFYSWMKKEEGSVRDKQICVGDLEAISKAIKEADVSSSCASGKDVPLKFINPPGFLQRTEDEEAADGGVVPEFGERVSGEGEPH